MTNPIRESMQGWIPRKFLTASDAFCVQWMYAGNEPFSDPFFDETLARLLNFSKNTGRIKCVSAPEMMVEWAEQLDTVPPAAFIFHVSRCGSTLVSQALAGSEANIALSEVPFFDAVLRSPYQNTTGLDIPQSLRAAVALYSQKRRRVEERAFIKTDSWHLLFYETLRFCYPHVPFIILYRRPDEVMRSHGRKRGLHAVPGLLEPEIFGLEGNTYAHAEDLDGYLDDVLRSYFVKMKAMASAEKNLLFLNYSEGIESIMAKISAFTNTSFTEDEWTRIRERSRYHAKFPQQTFREVEGKTNGICSPALMQLYEEIETLRLGAAAGAR